VRFLASGMVAQQYGLFREANGFSERANVLIDENQNVVFVKVYPVHNCAGYPGCNCVYQKSQKPVRYEVG
jgi:hypothetical protein